MGFKENLKAELSCQDVLVKELAARTGISKRTLDNYLRDKNSSPTAENAVKIAHALGVTVEYLIAGADAQEPDTDTEQAAGELHIIMRKLKSLSSPERQLVLSLISSIEKNLHTGQSVLPSR
ncbi:MAG: helix-turn-helix transcriptional regulator [Treponema sp.]|nr:helix-turn-helix transcriptional regulator [Treponema sp.]